jgi:transcriptional regulator with XRE-family HTH domain
MKDRLLMFMRHEGLSALRLSELLGVQPSSISHILSGRNRPGFDFIDKFIRRFPNVNIVWLISNQGQMLIDDTFKDTVPESAKTLSLFDNVNPELVVPHVASSTVPFTPHDTELVAEPGPTLQDTRRTEEIDRIVVFYTDKSFAIYHIRE